jgi:hypothetical protein
VVRFVCVVVVVVVVIPPGKLPWDCSFVSPDATGDNMWYSFNYGPVHFVQFDTETDFPNAPLATMCPDLPCGNFGPVGQLLAWLQKDLAAVRRCFVLAAWFSCGFTVDLAGVRLPLSEASVHGSL